MNFIKITEGLYKDTRKEYKEKRRYKESLINEEFITHITVDVRKYTNGYVFKKTFIGFNQQLDNYYDSNNNWTYAKESPSEIAKQMKKSLIKFTISAGYEGEGTIELYINPDCILKIAVSGKRDDFTYIELIDTKAFVVAEKLENVMDLINK